MFSVEQIKAAQRKVKSGADFPNCHAEPVEGSFRKAITI